MIIYLRRDQFLEEKLVYIWNEESRNFSFRTCPRLLRKDIYCHKNSIVIMNSQIFLLRIAISYIHINVRFNLIAVLFTYFEWYIRNCQYQALVNEVALQRMASR